MMAIGVMNTKTEMNVENAENAERWGLGGESRG